MKYGKVLLLVLVVSALAVGSVLADPPPTPLDVVSLTGGYTSFPHGGSNPGLIFGAVPLKADGTLDYVKLGKPEGTWGSVAGYRLGAAFAGPTLVDSLTITQTDAEGRWKIETLAMFADGAYVGTITLPYDQYEQQTVRFAPVQATWITLVVVSQYAGTGNDRNGGPTHYFFGGTPTGEPGSVNLNYRDPLVDMGKSVNVVNALNSNGVLNGGYASSRAHVISNNLVSNTTATAVYWPRGGLGCDTEQSLTVSYDTTQEAIGSVGIALAGDMGRDAPQWVIISGGTDDGEGHLTETYSETIFLDPVQLQYNRYDLPTVCKNVDWLRIAFPKSEFVEVLPYEYPEGATEEEMAAIRAEINAINAAARAAANAVDLASGNWYINGDVNFGLVNFQAFAPVPEPATMALLVLGGLAMLRRRK